MGNPVYLGVYNVNLFQLLSKSELRIQISDPLEIGINIFMAPWVRILKNMRIHVACFVALL